MAFNKTALNLNEYCKKGSLISLTGKVQSFSFEDEHKGKQFGMNIVADNIQYLSHSNDNKKNDSTSKQKD